jgi:hypothetical protein
MSGLYVAVAILFVLVECLEAHVLIARVIGNQEDRS